MKKCWGIQMSKALKDNNDLARFHSEPLAKNSRARGYDIYLVGLMVAAVFAVAIAQLIMQTQ
jgi:hypothetical protein